MLLGCSTACSQPCSERDPQLWLLSQPSIRCFHPLLVYEVGGEGEVPTQPCFRASSGCSAGAEQLSRRCELCSHTEVCPHLCPEELGCSCKVWAGFPLKSLERLPCPRVLCTALCLPPCTISFQVLLSIPGSRCAQQQREQLCFQALTRVL